MPCKHLFYYNYTPVTNSWSVASCLFKGIPYVPNMQELESYCMAGRHEQCPAFSQSLPPLDKYLWPDLEVIALAQSR